MRNKTLIIVGHPNAESYCTLIAERYANGVRSVGADATIVQLSEIAFDPILHKGYRGMQPLEEDLLALQEKIRDAQNLVFIYPIWWGGPPALLKGFIDRVFLPDFGFRFQKNSFRWEKLLEGRKARIITTMDAPKTLYKHIFGAPGDKIMKRAVLSFCGFKPVHITHIDRVSSRSDAWRKEKLEKIEKLGKTDAMYPNTLF